MLSTSSFARHVPLASASRRVLIVWLALALLLAQTLGMMHGVVHSPQAVAGDRAQAASQLAQVAQVQQTATLNANAGAAGHWIGALFSSHHGDNDCRLYDQASHGSAALHVVALPLPVVLPPFAVAIFQGEALARWAALFDARGPPLIG
ncbi:MAG: hypothetical protein JWQ72_2495 [Polaromonas sp.]|nr:hypothetical protein [Polaromonas sp.]